MPDEGITGGCGGGDFCPQNPVRRDQMAVFLLKAEHGSSYVPPAVHRDCSWTCRAPSTVRQLDRGARQRERSPAAAAAATTARATPTRAARWRCSSRRRSTCSRQPSRWRARDSLRPGGSAASFFETASSSAARLAIEKSARRRARGRPRGSSVYQPRASAAGAASSRRASAAEPEALVEAREADLRPRVGRILRATASNRRSDRSRFSPASAASPPVVACP